MSQEELLSCYDSQARHFHHTRGFYKRPELGKISEIVTSYENPHILDIGCGSGRIAGWLDAESISATYEGSDASIGMIAQARSTYPGHSFLHQDMLSYMKKQKQQSADVIIALASFHHLETEKDRLLTLHNIYKTLNYGGKAILVNRSYSYRFLEKYRPAVIQAGLLGACTFGLGKRKRNDVMVPRKDPDRKTNNKIFQRYYHMFTLRELHRLISYTEFSPQLISFVGADGNTLSNRGNSRNSICILEKR